MALSLSLQTAMSEYPSTKVAHGGVAGVQQIRFMLYGNWKKHADFFRLWQEYIGKYISQSCEAADNDNLNSSNTAMLEMARKARDHVLHMRADHRKVVDKFDGQAKTLPADLRGNGSPSQYPISIDYE